MTSPGAVRLERLEDVPPRVRPARHLDDAVFEEVLVDGVRVDDEEALVLAQQLVDGLPVVLGRVHEKDVLPRRDEDEEVRASTLVGRLHQHACRVGAEVGRRRARVGEHRRHQRAGELSDGGVPPADGAAGEREPLAPVHSLETVERQVLLPALDDGVGQQPRASQRARNGELFQRR